MLGTAVQICYLNLYSGAVVRLCSSRGKAQSRAGYPLDALMPDVDRNIVVRVTVIFGRVNTEVKELNTEACIK
jgi:hypothetical protein